ncbi:TPA: galactitol-1-phosphate 5-dehydrogenase [Enterococcus faecium]|uniref:galactitol-1-phosphate 5-dehydrogenase n=1 Tax=Enterococcus lactis TaxID=357441 RepID=UPI00241268ED|nr:galactitol-1-phosphate 5-dehydrogenase [Enterococcus lactis]HAQ4672473.1 galactitol-1-phosphate 5-dehydrogenase [Enterococcus faecium]HAQ4706622.1 galactitol-1-phosphate 5-dehydrogenase [Enterococcus faecium]HAR1638588.1 galactitol-1-phosphate 5-dehydrogenase [Enterococcus faecium]
MKALVITDNKKMEYQDIPVPETTAGKVKIKVAYCGICGSDLPRYFQGGVHAYPQVLGHEFSGVIEEIGQDVKSLHVGDRVAVAPLVPCFQCDNCQKGEPAMCTAYSFIGSREQGAMAEYIVVPEKNCVKVPEQLSLEEAALLEPLTVAIHGIERVNIPAGAGVLVLGAGTIGLLTVLSLQAVGVGKITVVDLNDKKLKLAQQIGADIVLNPKNTSLEEYYKDHQRPEVVVETAGSSITQRQAIEFVTKRGKVVYVGTSTKDVVLEPEVFELILRGELEVTGSWMSYSAPFPGYEWETGLRYMANGQIDVKPLITGKYQLSDVAIPFEKMIEPNSDAVKLLYAINKE